MSKTMSQDPIAALGARIERQLTAMDARHKAAEANRTQRAMKTAVPFALLNDTGAPTGGSVASTSVEPGANPTTATNTDFEVGATFRRKGELSDVPMTVTRAGDGVVVAAFSDSAGSYEVAFDANQLELVTKAPAAQVPADVQYFPSLIDLVRKSAPLAMAASATDAVPAASVATANAVVDAAPATAAATVVAAVPATVASPTPTPAAALNPVVPAVAAPDLTLPAGAIRLPDGTLQFPYAPTGSVPGRVPVKQPPVPPEFGVGATFRRKDVIGDIPMTVTRVGDGVLMANITFADRDGRKEMAFIPDQLDLVTRAPPEA
jgi:hypothetical protein